MREMQPNGCAAKAHQIARFTNRLEWGYRYRDGQDVRTPDSAAVRGGGQKYGARDHAFPDALDRRSRRREGPVSGNLAACVSRLSDAQERGRTAPMDFSNRVEPVPQSGPRPDAPNASYQER